MDEIVFDQHLKYHQGCDHTRSGENFVDVISNDIRRGKNLTVYNFRMIY